MNKDAFSVKGKDLACHIFIHCTNTYWAKVYVIMNTLETKLKLGRWWPCSSTHIQLLVVRRRVVGGVPHGAFVIFLWTQKKKKKKFEKVWILTIITIELLRTIQTIQVHYDSPFISEYTFSKMNNIVMRYFVKYQSE